MSAISMATDPDDDDATALKGLRDASLHDLRVEWRRTFRHHPPPGLTRTLLFGMIAYQRQAEVYGDLESRHQAFLDRIGERIVRAREAQGKEISGREGEGRYRTVRRPLVPPVPTNSMQIGTVLVREWNGTAQAVTVVEGGFLWAGTTYATLSAVANAITGRHWNGWVFFGLKTPVSRRLREGISSPPKMPDTIELPQVTPGQAAAKSPPSTAPSPSAEPPRRRGRPPKARPIIATEARP